MKEHQVDKIFLGVTLALLAIGISMFVSASLGILTKNINVFYSVLISQIGLGLGLGTLGLIFCYKMNYKFWRKYSLYIFLGSILVTALVFVPHLGFRHGGALRWIAVGPISFQPAELLKFGFVIYFAAWLSWAKNKVRDFKFGMLPLAIMLGIIALVLFKQPDTKSFVLIAVTGFSMLLLSGVPWKYLAGLIVLSLVGLSFLVFFTPYLKDRVKTFVDPSRDPTGSSYQLQQSLIAIGSGGVWGRGFGQSIQKFSYLPEPQGDSIFAVIGEEWGFIGSVAVIVLFLAFAMRGLRIANRAPDLFGKLLCSGIIMLLVSQAFMNIASIIGVFPLTGVPLVFMSHGGTSLMIDLMAVGIVLHISKYRTQT